MAAFNWGAMLQGMTGVPNLANVINGTQPPEAAATANPFQIPTTPATPGIGDGLPQNQGADIAVTRPEPHKGMFGVKGTLRDILGTLGDAFLVNAGRDPVYSTRRQAEKYSDAIGSDFNTENAMNAVDRLQQAGMGKEAMALYNQIQEQEIARQKQASTSAYQGARTTDQGYQNLGRLFAGADEKSFPALRAIAERRAGMYGIDPSELPTTLEGAKRWGLDTYRSNRLDQFDDEQDLREQNVTDQIADRSARRDLTRRGQDLQSTDRRRGQDMASSDRAAQRAVTTRGQDIRSADQRRGQDIRGSSSKSSAGKSFTPDPNKIYIQNGKRFKYNASTKKYEAL